MISEMEGSTGTHILRTLRPQEEVPWMMDVIVYETSTLLPVFVFTFSHIWLLSTSLKPLLTAEVITTPKDICVQDDWKTGGEHSDVIWRSLAA